MALEDLKAQAVALLDQAFAEGAASAPASDKQFNQADLDAAVAAAKSGLKEAVKSLLAAEEEDLKAKLEAL